MIMAANNNISSIFSTVVGMFLIGLPVSLLKVRLLTCCYGEVYEEELAKEAHSIIDTWDISSLTSEQTEIIGELRNLEENQYPFEVID